MNVNGISLMVYVSNEYTLHSGKVQGAKRELCSVRVATAEEL